MVLLCHNERASLPPLVDRLEPVLQALAPDAHEIIVVDDGSSDGTGEWARERALTSPVRVVRHLRRRGYGRAVRTGLASAAGLRVAYMDGDGQYDPGQLRSMMEAMDAGGYDIVAGVRADRRDPPHRRALGATYNLLMRRITGACLDDVDCGFKLLGPRTLTALTLHCDGNLLGAELMSKAVRAGLAIKQMPVEHVPRRHGRAKGADAFAIAGAVREVITHWRELRPSR